MNLEFSGVGRRWRKRERLCRDGYSTQTYLLWWVTKILQLRAAICNTHGWLSIKKRVAKARWNHGIHTSQARSTTKSHLVIKAKETIKSSHGFSFQLKTCLFNLQWGVDKDAVEEREMAVFPAVIGDFRVFKCTKKRGKKRKKKKIET